jgi:hypothetical protein
MHHPKEGSGLASERQRRHTTRKRARENEEQEQVGPGHATGVVSDSLLLVLSVTHCATSVLCGTFVSLIFFLLLRKCKIRQRAIRLTPC